MANKHLYKFVGKTGQNWEHSNLCWCEQLRNPGNSYIFEGFTDDFEMMYPHEAGDIHCRCEEPVVDIDDHNEIRCSVCRICGKVLG